MDDHAHKQHNGKLRFSLFSIYAPAGLENNWKHKSVNEEHKQRVEEWPGETKDGSLVAAYNFTLRHLDYKLAIAPETAQQRY